MTSEALERLERAVRRCDRQVDYTQINTVLGLLNDLLESARAALASSQEPALRPGEVLSDEPTWTFTEYQGKSKGVVVLNKDQADHIKAFLMKSQKHPSGLVEVEPGLWTKP